MAEKGRGVAEGCRMKQATGWISKWENNKIKKGTNCCRLSRKRRMKERAKDEGEGGG